MTISLDIDSPITTGDTSAAIVYRITDVDGTLWRSAPKILVNAMRADGIESGTSVNASGQWFRVPTLRHLLPGTDAQIEIYLGDVDLNLFRVIANDPTVDYIDICPQNYYVSGGIMPSLTSAIEQAGIGEILYTTGDALANDPPPQMRCLTVWRNRVIGCNGNTIYPSQEFADGIGCQWSYVLNVQWLEGSGDIIAICPIDWNYCAVFKRDAIGILSGQGPDGTGHGGYIIQTLATKAGTNNPKSVVNGADGAYFQDYSTGRMMVVAPNAAVNECCKGWFNEESATITAAIQVESRRQIWFATSSKHIIVLDYKHRTDASPFGQVYDWDLTGFSDEITGFSVVGGVVTSVFADGTLASYTDTYSKDTTKGAVDVAILMTIETGELQPFGLAGEGDICSVQTLGEFLATHGLTMTTYPQFSTSGTAVSISVTAAPQQVGTRPPNCQRIQSMRVKIQETQSTPTTYNKAFKFVGLAMMVQPRGKVQTLGTGRIV